VHVLYRLFDRGGNLLYVGITNDVKARFANHASLQPWWLDVATCRTEFFPTREALERGERAAIKAERPRHNTMYNTRRAPVPVAPRPARRGAAPRRREPRAGGLEVLSLEPQIFRDRFGLIVGKRTVDGGREIICGPRDMLPPTPGHEHCGWTR